MQQEQKRKQPEQILAIAERLARRMGVDREEAKDIAQSVALKFHLHPDSNQTISHAIVDYLRATLGDPRSANPAKQIPEPWDFPPDIQAPDRALYGDLSRDEIELLDQASLKPNHRATILLKFAFGMEHREIAFLFGLSTVRVTQLVAEALESLRASATNRDT